MQHVHPADAGGNAQPHAALARGLLPEDFLGQLPVIFEDTGIGGGDAAAGLLEPVEHLCGRIDLVVVPAIREGAQLVQILGEPRCRVGEVDKAVFDHCRLRVHAHDLVELRLVAGHRVEAFGDQLLDQLGARGLVLDQYDTRAKPLVLRAHRALELGILHALPQYVDQIEVLARYPPAGADAVIAELGPLLAVSQLCTMRSNCGTSSTAYCLNHTALTSPPPNGEGACWYWPAKLYSPIVLRICSSIASGSRAGCSASPRRRSKQRCPNGSSTTNVSSSSAIAGRRTISQSSCASTWPTRSSSCSRCMIRMIAPLCLSLSRL